MLKLLVYFIYFLVYQKETAHIPHSTFQKSTLSPQFNMYFPTLFIFQLFNLNFAHWSPLKNTVLIAIDNLFDI